MTERKFTCLLLILVQMLYLSAISPVFAADIDASASRTAGVAPLSVHFNADLWQSAPTESRFHDLDYAWDFGDPSSGHWGVSDKSKNSAKGPVAAHVFEDPGTYTVTLTVNGPAGLVETKTFTITVEDPDTVFAGTKTTCISDTARNDFTGCPQGAAQLTTDDLSVLPEYSQTGERVLLGRGSSWDATEGVYPRTAVPGPVHIGAYGECENPDDLGICANAPVVNVTDAGIDAALVNLYRKHDWRISDITFTPDSDESYGVVSGSTDIRDLLVLRVKAEGFYNTAVGWSHWRERDGDNIQQTSIVSCSISDGTGNQVYIGSEDFALLGNSLHNSKTTHVARVWWIYRGVIGHNRISGSSLDNTNGRHALKFHGPQDGTGVGDFATTGGGGLPHRTTFAVVSDNIFGSSGPWPVSIGPQDAGKVENLSDIIVERNRFYAGYGLQSATPVQIGLMFEGRYFTIRNNVVDGTGGANGYTGIFVARRGIEWTPLGNCVYNNTIYNKDDVVNSMVGIKIHGDAQDTIVRNNLIAFPDETAETSIEDLSGTATISNNLLTDSPHFMDPDNGDPLLRDFRITELAVAAIDQGYAVSSVYDDFNGNPRTGLFELGAHIYGSGDAPDPDPDPVPDPDPDPGPDPDPDPDPGPDPDPDPDPDSNPDSNPGPDSPGDGSSGCFVAIVLSTEP